MGTHRFIVALTLVGALFQSIPADAVNGIANEWEAYYGPGGASGIDSNTMVIMDTATTATATMATTIHDSSCRFIWRSWSPYRLQREGFTSRPSTMSLERLGT